MDDSPTNPAGHPRRWSILAILCGSLVLVVVSVSSLNVALPTIQRVLGTSASELQWIVDAYALTFAGFLLPAGAVGDRFGRRRALLGGLAVFAASSLASVFASDALALIGWRGLMGIGAAAIMPSTLSIIATVFPEGERGRAIAIWAGFAGAGGVIGLVLAGGLLSAFPWTAIFVVNVPLALGLAVAVVALVPESRDPAAAPLDLPGAGLSIIGLGGLVFAVIEAPEAGLQAPTTLIALALAVGALILFVRHELRVPHPMLDPRLFRLRGFALGAWTITAAFFGIFAMFFATTQVLQFVHGHSAWQTSVRIMPYGVVLLVAAPLSAPLVERLGTRLPMAAGSALTALGFVSLGLVSAEGGYGWIGGGLVLVALGTGLLMPPATTIMLSSLPPAKAGVGSAVNDATREIGGSVGIAVAGALMSIGYRNGMEDSLVGLPERIREAGLESLGAFLSATADLTPQVRDPLVSAAHEAFTSGTQLGMFAAAAIMAFTTVLVALRGR